MVVRVQALAGDIVLCSWARHSTLTAPPSTQEYKWVPANCWGNLTGGVEILLAASCYENQDKLWPNEPVLTPKASRVSFLRGNELGCMQDKSQYSIRIIYIELFLSWQ